MKHKTVSTWQVKGLLFKHDSENPRVVVCHNEGPHETRTFSPADLDEMALTIREVAAHIEATK